MSEPKKLTEQELDQIRYFDQVGYEEDDEGRSSALPEIHIGDLLQHIDAMKAEQVEHLKRLSDFVDAMRTIVYDANHDHHLATNWATAQVEKALDELFAGADVRTVLALSYSRRLEGLLNRCVQILRVAEYDESMPHSIINQIIAELGPAYQPIKKE